MTTTAIILAAGLGTRMKSALPKTLHKIAGRPMLHHLLDSAGQVFDRIVVVVGPDMEQVAQAAAPYAVVVQQDRLGTAHAALQAEALFGESGVARGLSAGNRNGASSYSSTINPWMKFSSALLLGSREIITGTAKSGMGLGSNTPLPRCELISDDVTSAVPGRADKAGNSKLGLRLPLLWQLSQLSPMRAP